MTSTPKPIITGLFNPLNNPQSFTYLSKGQAQALFLQRDSTADTPQNVFPDVYEAGNFTVEDNLVVLGKTYTGSSNQPPGISTVSGDIIIKGNLYLWSQTGTDTTTTKYLQITPQSISANSSISISSESTSDFDAVITSTSLRPPQSRAVYDYVQANLISRPTVSFVNTDTTITNLTNGQHIQFYGTSSRMVILPTPSGNAGIVFHVAYNGGANAVLTLAITGSGRYYQIETAWFDFTYSIQSAGTVSFQSDGSNYIVINDSRKGYGICGLLSTAVLSSNGSNLLTWANVGTNYNVRVNPSMSSEIILGNGVWKISIELNINKMEADSRGTSMANGGLAMTLQSAFSPSGGVISPVWGVAMASSDYKGSNSDSKYTFDFLYNASLFGTVIRMVCTSPNSAVYRWTFEAGNVSPYWSTAQFVQIA